MTKFNEVKERYFERLEQYVPVVERVHGGTHPEFRDVRKWYDQLAGKIKEGKMEKPELDEEFKQLRNITNNYTVPRDTCESYEAVYEMLAQWDKAYHG